MSNDDEDDVESTWTYGDLLDHPERVQALLKEKYKVGYQRPPKGNQFKPGQSGNPKGRPKGSKNLRASLEGILTEPISVRKGDRVQKVTSLQAVIMTNLNKALKGDQRAIDAIYKTAKELGLLIDRPQRLIVDSLSDFTRDELVEFRRLLIKANGRYIPI